MPVAKGLLGVKGWIVHIIVHIDYCFVTPDALTLQQIKSGQIMKQKFCQSCGMPLTDEILGTNADGSKNEDYCIYCYKDGKFLQDCTMEEMIAFCAQFVDEVNKNLPQPMTKEEYIGQMKMYFPHLKRWHKE